MCVLWPLPHDRGRQYPGRLVSAVDAHADVQAGICGLRTHVTAHGGDGYSVSFDIVTDCETVAALAMALTEHGPFNALEEIDPRTPSGLLAVVSMHLKGCCAGCAVPVGLFKAMQVAAGLALPKDVEIGLSIDRTTRAEQTQTVDGTTRREATE